MAYRFKARDSSVEHAVRRIAREQAARALSAIEHEPSAIATHEVRKSCKKIRALIRLVRPAFPDYAAENARFRDMARLMAGSRDAKVVVDTCRLLIDDARGDLGEDFFAPLLDELEAAGSGLVQGEVEDAHLEKVRVLLEESRERAADWSVEDRGWGAIGAGLAKVICRAGKAATVAAADPSAANFHELRKRMKYHWYHARLLVQIWPEVMKARADQLSLLADNLGLHHDIAVFEQRLTDLHAGGAHPHAVACLQSLALERREALERTSKPLIERILAQSAEDLEGHWGKLWQIWRAGTAHKRD
ncbi:CHAD domain-containing protein [Novosphingobium mathurense]|uniref:CHAD domain-containing protein n=1 Tax=Novosphingobium mathurense TaxID=428990 RepID=A0A1U6IF99_9SPHN|nr:CHAD domain-containing protein [Novosphingobium mathurense]SLK06670.1 CHAD domain-containing protein [Novosphingobium mathurense]